MGIGKSCRMFAKLDDGVIEKKDTWIFSKLTCTIFEKRKTPAEWGDVI